MIIDSVIAKRAQPAKRSVWSPFRTRIFFRSSAALGLLMVTLPALFFLFVSSHEEDDYRAKGDDSTPILALNCIEENGAHTCTKGSIVTFKVRPPEGRYFFSAFARHQKSGTVVWYYPATESEESLSLEENQQVAVLDAGVVIGDEHTIGEYDVYGIFSKSPHKREDIRKVFDRQYHMDTEGSNVDEYNIIKTTIQIQ
jgi:hypothetical protein